MSLVCLIALGHVLLFYQKIYQIIGTANLLDGNMQTGARANYIERMVDDRTIQKKNSVQKLVFRSRFWVVANCRLVKR